MNKFDDMMFLLSAGSSRFAQVVAVDKQFVIFSRSWCVAEIAAAHAAGMPQSLRLPSLLTLEANKDALGSLKIADMQASRPEDKEEILSRISDHEAFDAKLHDLLMGQLLPSWSKMDSSDQMTQAGRIARWQSVVKKHSRRIWQFGVDGAGLSQSVETPQASVPT
jgi:hypothetical protein